MKLQILQKKLKEGLGVVGKISSKSLTLPILNNILISTEKSFLNLASTDLEIGINWWSLVKTEKEGKITIPSHTISEFIGLLPDKKINLNSENNTLDIECDNYKTQIKGLPVDDFPIIPKISDGDFTYFPNKSFCQSLGQVADIAVPSATRPEISGIYFLFQKNLITMAATDSFRLAEKKVPIKNGPSFKKSYALILPQKSAKEIINIFSGIDGESKVYFSTNQIMFELPMQETEHPQIQLISRLIEGEYPNYQEIIPQKYSTQLILDKNEIVNLIKSASIFSGKAGEVKIKTDAKKKAVKVLSESQEVGAFESFIPAKIKGEDVEIVFNHRFLSDGFANIKSAEIILELNGDSGPGVLRPVGDQTYIYVVMPIKAG